MGSSSNILIVDDNPHNLEALAAILKRDGYKVRAALSGELALRAAQSQAPDLVLLDVRMPGMDGYQTCRLLKAEPQLHDIPVIFISALTEVEEKLDAFRCGAVDFITKPFQAEEVLARVRTQMELAEARLSLAGTNAQLVALMTQLAQSEKNKSLGALARGVSHELNTPISNAMLSASSIGELIGDMQKLAASQGCSELFAPLLAHFHSGLQLVTRNLHRAGKMLDSLSEVTANGMEERMRSVSLYDCVRNVVTVLGARRGEALGVQIEIDPRLAVETYAGHLEQVIEKLVENAAAFTAPLGMQGIIKATAWRDEDGAVTLTISDNGPGMQAQHLERAFTPFFTTRGEQGGKGLGLYVAYSLATGLLGGTLQVASMPGHGAEFSLTLPPTLPCEICHPHAVLAGHHAIPSLRLGQI
ncbi:hybrid sensor histidine kinase/response regulator [Pseudoduganella sp. OTU4001]|uniref:hybrid sensor histidine kinase/response regulator n=1 Tax=Pseudoduganella sp. OTU4001 TaxID=3043854 RepID=UPI00313EB375